MLTAAPAGGTADAEAVPLFEMPPDPDWHPDNPSSAAGTVVISSEHERERHYALAALLPRSVRSWHRGCGRFGFTDVTQDNRPARERNTIVSCHCLDHASCAHRLADGHLDATREGLVLPHAARGHAVRIITYTVAHPAFTPLPPGCDTAETGRDVAAGKYTRRQLCPSGCVDCDKARPAWDAAEAWERHFVQLATQISRRPTAVARRLVRPRFGCSLQIAIAELEGVAVTYAPPTRDAAGKVIPTPPKLGTSVAHDEATERTHWLSALAALGATGTYRVQVLASHRAIEDELERLHVPYADEVDAAWRAHKLSDTEALGELRRLRVSRPAASGKRKVVRRIEWLGAMAAGHHDETLRALSVERTDEDPPRVWLRQSAWAARRRVAPGQYEVEDLVTATRRVLTLDGSTRTGTRSGHCVCRERRPRFAVSS